ncbi:MAG: M20/M25/M40 family metallo-hydrolase [Myxococcus sp.]|nr:M20/M25/M40 family metallo-hydrolase [Myxococcus sp.]
MSPKPLAVVVRLVLPVAAAVALWNLAVPSPVVRGLDAPLDTFSAARADATLARLLGHPELPHPVSTPENAAVRDRVLAEFAALGVTARVERGRGCRGSTRYDVFSCATVENIVAPIVEGDGPAVALLAHYDSVPAGPGAGDDLSGVAAVLETLRVLKARGLATRHPVFALITDGEEAGLLGAQAYLSNPEARPRIGAVVNVEARGTSGLSSLFQTSGGDGPLISLYARRAPLPMTSSLSNLVYKKLPNDTDLTLFIDAGLTSFNLAFLENGAHYHTPLDRRANVSAATLQHQGDNLLAITEGLLEADFAALEGDDSISWSVLGVFVPRLPQAWAPPLGALALLMILVSAVVSRGVPSTLGRRLLAGGAPLFVVGGGALLGWALHALAAKVSGNADPSYATPAVLRGALALGVGAVTVLASRAAGPRLMALSAWSWLAGLAALTAVLAPGASPMFLFPALVAAPLVLGQSRRAEAWRGLAGTLALAVASFAALLHWLPLARLLEPVQGLSLHPAFTVPVGFAAVSALPLLAALEWSRRAWLLTASLLAALALGAAFTAGLVPAYSPDAPQRLNLTWVDDHVAGRGRWVIDTPGALPTTFKQVAPFSETRERAWPVAFSEAFIAEAGPTRSPPPTASFTTTVEGQGRAVRLVFDDVLEADRRFVVIPRGAGLTRLEVDGFGYTPKASSGANAGTLYACCTRDCGGTAVTLHFDSMRPVDVWVAQQRYQLPHDAAPLIAARPPNATPSQTGDTTVGFSKVRLP